jgi:hypothetical protein
MCNAQNSKPVIVVTCEQLLAHGREACELRSSPRCESFTRPVFVRTPAGVVPACPTCAEVEVVIV